MQQRIDVHHHILPSRYVAEVGTHAIGAQGSSGKVPHWSVEHAIQKMDESGISTAITSITAPGLLVDGEQRKTALARWCNEFSASMVGDYPGRFGMFAALPLPDVDAALHEAAYAYDDLNADGVCLLSNYNGSYLGDSAFFPLYEELDRREAVVFVHPTSPMQPVSIAGLSASTLEFTFDTTRTVASLIFSGVVQKFPRIRFIFSHMGGAMPYLAERTQLLLRNNPSMNKFVPNGLSNELRKFYFDTALSANMVTFSAMRELGLEGNILLGTDYPFGPSNQIEDAVESLGALPLSAELRRDIELHNANKLFPRLLKVNAKE